MRHSISVSEVSEVLMVNHGVATSADENHSVIEMSVNKRVPYNFITLSV